MVQDGLDVRAHTSQFLCGDPVYKFHLCGFHTLGILPDDLASLKREGDLVVQKCLRSADYTYQTINKR